MYLSQYPYEFVVYYNQVPMPSTQDPIHIVYFLPLRHNKDPFIIVYSQQGNINIHKETFYKSLAISTHIKGYLQRNPGFNATTSGWFMQGPWWISMNQCALLYQEEFPRRASNYEKRVESIRHILQTPHFMCPIYLIFLAFLRKSSKIK